MSIISTAPSPELVTLWKVTTISSLLLQLVSEYCIDLDSIHHTGISNGGEFAYQVAAYNERSISPSRQH